MAAHRNQLNVSSQFMANADILKQELEYAEKQLETARMEVNNDDTTRALQKLTSDRSILETQQIALNEEMRQLSKMSETVTRLDIKRSEKEKIEVLVTNM